VTFVSRTSALVALVTLFVLADATACGGDPGSAQGTATAPTPASAPSSDALNEALADLEALVDERLAQIEASTDKRALRKALSEFTTSLIAAEGRLRQFNTPPETADELDALLGAIGHAEESLGGDAVARLASSSVEETKVFIQTFARLDEVRAAIDALQESR
jgi:hypothetical protein